MTLYRILVYNKYLQFYAQFRQINIRQFLHGSIFMGHSRRFSYLRIFKLYGSCCIMDILLFIYKFAKTRQKQNLKK